MRLFKPTSIETAYDAACEFLGGKETVKIDHNTYMINMGPVYPNYIAIVLHGNEIITYHPTNVITVDTCGHNTKTTRDRLNKFLPVGMRVWQKAFIPYIGWEGQTQELVDGMVIQ